jgi:hypothetical protein
MQDFGIIGQPAVRIDLIDIVDNYRILHFDEFPILYLGTNKFGNKILGSHLDESDEQRKIFCLHTILTNKQYTKFLSGRVSYQSILNESNTTFFVVKDYNSIIQDAFEYSFNLIPNDYIPLEDSFCPSTYRAHSLIFTLSLKGKLADLNKAITEEVSKMQNGFTEFLEGRISALKELNLVPKSILQPYSDGSFRINFELQIQPKAGKPNMFLQNAPISNYISNYIQYLSNDFTSDKDKFKLADTGSSEKLTILGNVLNDIYEKTGVRKLEDITSFLKEDIIKSTSKFEKISEQVGENFESVEIINVSDDIDYPLAYLDRSFSETFQNAIEEVEVSIEGSITDDDYQNYKIYIYHLNTDTRSGNAFIRNVGTEEDMSKPKIKIGGDEGLEQTKFTESLYLNKWIDVRAKAKRIGNRFKQLDIKFE